MALQLRSSWFRHAVPLAAGLVATAIWAQESEDDPAKRHGSYSNAQLEAVCEAMSTRLYVSGLTDEAWIAIPGSGRTYFRRSACFLELARRTGRAELCTKVVERRTLLGNGSAHSPASCAKVVAQYAARQEQDRLDAAAHVKATQGMFELGHVTAREMPNGNWRLSARVTGTRSGSYRLEIDNSRDRKRLVTQQLTLTQDTDLLWEIGRADVAGATSLPNIFPIALTLFYLPAHSGSRRAVEYMTTVKNVTVSAQ